MTALKQVFLKVKLPRYLSWQNYCCFYQFLLCHFSLFDLLLCSCKWASTFASRSCFPSVHIQNNFKYMAICAAQGNGHIGVSRHLWRLKPCSWLKDDSVHCNALYRKSIGKNYCLKMLFQANVRWKKYVSIKLLVLAGDRRIYGFNQLLCSFIFPSE